MLDFLGKEKEKIQSLLHWRDKININIKVELSAQVKTVSITGTQNQD